MAVQKFPGFIDIHVHLRDPGSTHKEDFFTASMAALAGGFTTLLDMPNNPGAPTLSIERLNEKIALSSKSLCDIGFHYGTDGTNTASFAEASHNPRVFGLKIYCDHTTGDLLVEDEKKIDHIFAHWESDKPILVHAEGEHINLVIDMARVYKRRLHICHIATLPEVKELRKAKEMGLTITAGVTPHHLFLTEEHVRKLGNKALVRPAIGTEEDRLALWEALNSGMIDLVESDHAPHTLEEKMRSTPSFGVPGLETTLGLLLKAEREKTLKRSIVELLYEKPRRIFMIPEQNDTYIELDPTVPWVVGSEGYKTKANWSPFEGWELYGKVQRVVLRGKELVREGKVL